MTEQGKRWIVKSQKLLMTEQGQRGIVKGQKLLKGTKKNCGEL